MDNEPYDELLALARRLYESGADDAEIIDAAFRLATNAAVRTHGPGPVATSLREVAAMLSDQHAAPSLSAPVLTVATVH